jgi:hypothetical protein
MSQFGPDTAFEGFCLGIGHDGQENVDDRKFPIAAAAAGESAPNPRSKFVLHSFSQPSWS